MDGSPGHHQATTALKLESTSYDLIPALIFKAMDVNGFYPYVDVVFTITEGSEHYHVPLLISPFGYSTYRGS